MHAIHVIRRGPVSKRRSGYAAILWSGIAIWLADIRKRRDLCALCVKCVGGNETMKLRVQFYAQLRDLTEIRELELNLSEGATVRELLEKIYAQRPALRAHDKSILVGVGLEFVDRNYKLNPGEEIAIMPPVQGG